MPVIVGGVLGLSTFFFVVFVWLQFFSILYETHFLLITGLLLGQLITRIMRGLRYDYHCQDNDTPMPRDIIEQLTTPVFFIYSESDPVIGIAEAEIHEVYSRVRATKRLHIFPEPVIYPVPGILTYLHYDARMVRTNTGKLVFV